MRRTGSARRSIWERLHVDGIRRRSAESRRTKRRRHTQGLERPQRFRSAARIAAANDLRYRARRLRLVTRSDQELDVRQRIFAEEWHPFTVESGSDGWVSVTLTERSATGQISWIRRSLDRSSGIQIRRRSCCAASAFAYMNAPTQMAGNPGRATFRKGKIANVNASVSRTFAVAGDWTATLRAESINRSILRSSPSPAPRFRRQTSGQITNTLNDGRAFRFTLRMSF